MCESVCACVVVVVFMCLCVCGRTIMDIHTHRHTHTQRHFLNTHTELESAAKFLYIMLLIAMHNRVVLCSCDFEWRPPRIPSGCHCCSIVS